MSETFVLPPLISYVIASYNSAPFLKAAVLSALNQEGVRVEVLIVDDGSVDGSAELARDLANAHNGVRFLKTERNGGPGAARNLGLRELNGSWFAVLDSDDVLKADRTQRLLALAESFDADMIADDLEIFSSEDPVGSRFIDREDNDPFNIHLNKYLEHSVIYSGKQNLGFLKPMIRVQFLKDNHIRYDEKLRIGEDDKLVIASLLAGARYLVSPEAGYRYRKHEASISHRLSPSDADAMIAANRELAAALGSHDRATRRAFKRRSSAMRDAGAFAHAIQALKQRRIHDSLMHILARPRSLRLFSMPLKVRAERFMARVFTRRRDL